MVLIAGPWLLSRGLKLYGYEWVAALVSTPSNVTTLTISPFASLVGAKPSLSFLISEVRNDELCLLAQVTGKATAPTLYTPMLSSIIRHSCPSWV